MCVFYDVLVGPLCACGDERLMFGSRSWVRNGLARADASISSIDALDVLRY